MDDLDKDLAEARARNADRLSGARRHRATRQTTRMMEQGFGLKSLSSRVADLARVLELNPDYRYNGGKKDFKKYGITEADWRWMVATQDSRCAICGTRFEYVKALAIDHCHKTGAVRGLLCKHCNTGLGHFKDNPSLLKRAISYLERNQHTVGLQERRDTAEAG
jgi:hypothetical protein